jgi:anti-anti-sigma factor
VRLSGDIDLDTVGRLRAEILAAVAGCPGPVTIDTGRLTYLGSVGVRLLAEAIELGDGRVRLSVPPGSVTETHLAVSGFRFPG